MSHELILSLAGLTRAYRAGVPGCAATINVLSGVSLEMRAGELVHIAGEAGSGKTTLLLCAAGLLRPDGGTVAWPALGTRTTQAPRTLRYVGDRATTYGFLTVRESLSYATTLRQIDEPHVQSPDHDLLELAGLRDLSGTRVALLSRGERARLLLALALVSAPRLLVVDDVSADCDDTSSVALGESLMRVAQSGVGVLWASRRVPTHVAGAMFELVRGRLRSRSGVAKSGDAGGENQNVPAAHATVKRLPRVAEP